jgi:predicted GNAT superfamily acetyltransferase
MKLNFQSLLKFFIERIEFDPVNAKNTSINIANLSYFG